MRARNRRRRIRNFLFCINLLALLGILIAWGMAFHARDAFFFRIGGQSEFGFAANRGQIVLYHIVWIDPSLHPMYLKPFIKTADSLFPFPAMFPAMFAQLRVIELPLVQIVSGRNIPAMFFLFMCTNADYFSVTMPILLLLLIAAIWPAGRLVAHYWQNRPRSGFEVLPGPPRVE